jgi:hypothetical protein
MGKSCTLRMVLLASCLHATACTAPGQPTSIHVTGTLTGGGGSDSVTMSHGTNLTASPSLVIASAPLSAGDVNHLSLNLSRTGIATPTGYELMVIFFDYVLGGGAFGGASAGDRTLFDANTGSIAKTSYYYFEDSGEQAAYTIPPAASGWAARLILYRVRQIQGKFARVPFIESGPAAGGFLSVGCLTGGRDPCFDMSTLIGTLFTELSDAFTTAVADRPNLALGGSDGAGDFRMDYLPAINALRGCGATPAADPAFGFIFGATVDAPLGIQARVRIPMVFSLVTEPSPGGGRFLAVVHPFDDIGGCQETQFVDAITVHTTTFLGVGAQEIANLVQTSIVCSLFGPTVGSFDCGEITPAPLNPMLISGLGSMMGNTVTYYWRDARGNTPIPPQFGAVMRARAADDRVTSTNVTPGAAGAVQVELVITE